jgi:hypothetical protein
VGGRHLDQVAEGWVLQVGSGTDLDVPHQLTGALQHALWRWQLGAVVEAEDDVLGLRGQPAKLLAHLFRARSVSGGPLAGPNHLHGLRQDIEDQRPAGHSEPTDLRRGLRDDLLEDGGVAGDDAGCGHSQSPPSLALGGA